LCHRHTPPNKYSDFHIAIRVQKECAEIVEKPGGFDGKKGFPARIARKCKTV
jgi:hypothetical protein